jgi:hypothetical protein
MFGKPGRLMVLLNLALLVLVGLLVYSSWGKGGRRVRISPVVQSINPPVVVRRDGEAVYLERGRGADLQLTAAGHSMGGPP